MSFTNLILLKVCRFWIILSECFLLNPLCLLCRVLDRLTITIREKIVDSLIPRVKDDNNFFCVFLHLSLLISPGYVVNRLWVLLLDRICGCGFLPTLDPHMNPEIYGAGTMGLMGINGIEVLETCDGQKIMCEKTGTQWIRYEVHDDMLKILGSVNHIRDLARENAMHRIPDKELISHTESLLSQNINRLSYINSKIYGIASIVLPFSHPVMRFIRAMTSETLYDRIVFADFSHSAKNDQGLEQSDLSSLHRFTRSFGSNDELMLNFHFYKYCQQMQRILGQFVDSFCLKHRALIHKNNNIVLFVQKVSEAFKYEDQDEVLPDTGFEFHTDSGLTLDDVLIAVIFNVIEYSMNRIFIETYWEYQGSFPIKSGRGSGTILSRIMYGKFMDKMDPEIIGSRETESLLCAMQVLYSRMRQDKAPFVECIDPYKMKACCLSI